MNVLRDGEFVSDSWQTVADDDELPDGDVVLSVARWQALASTQYSGRRIALRLSADSVVEGAILDYNRFAMIAVEFIPFTDGRGYSIARTLRRNGYDGDLRAIGEIQRDQAFFLARCGFTSLAADNAAAAADLQRAFDEFSQVFQASADDRIDVAQIRRRRWAAASGTVPPTGPASRLH